VGEPSHVLSHVCRRDACDPGMWRIAPLGVDANASPTRSLTLPVLIAGAHCRWDACAPSYARRASLRLNDICEQTRSLTLFGTDWRALALFSC
jgi:hypothetical protein